MSRTTRAQTPVLQTRLQIWLVLHQELHHGTLQPDMAMINQETQLEGATLYQLGCTSHPPWHSLSLAFSFALGSSDNMVPRNLKLAHLIFRIKMSPWSPTLHFHFRHSHLAPWQGIIKLVWTSSMPSELSGTGLEKIRKSSRQSRSGAKVWTS
jgi:hypothetical protein